MERVTFEEYEAAKAAVLYGKEYEETSSMENNVIHKQYVCKDGSGIFYERTENGVTEFWSTEYSKSRILSLIHIDVYKRQGTAWYRAYRFSFHRCRRSNHGADGGGRADRRNFGFNNP